jgi:hypothetical protein
MRIEYTCEDGSRTLALRPSMALPHWPGRAYPNPPIKNPEPFKFYVTGASVAGDEMFLTLVYTEIERRWNRTPPFEVVPPGPKVKHGGRKYQAHCLEILQWLHADGDITKLIISPKS